MPIESAGEGAGKHPRTGEAKGEGEAPTKVAGEGGFPSEPALAATACMFLTRLPVSRWASGDPAALAASTRYFPLVGALVAIIQVGVFWVTTWLLPTNLPIALLCALVSGVILTGALHEDGLADVADSIGAFDRDRKLSIMRDSRVGTYGAIALVLLFGFRYSALMSIANPTLPGLLVSPDSPLGVEMGLDTMTMITISTGPDTVLMSTGLLLSLIAAHSLARWSCVYLMFSEPYARAEAANRVVASGVTGRRLVGSTALSAACLLPGILLFGLAWALLLPMAFVLTVLCGRLFRRWYGGITGDCLGAANQVVEVSVLIAIGAIYW